MGAQRLELVVVGELERQKLSPDERVGRLPRLGAVASEQELGRQRVLVAFQEGVDSVGIGREPLLRPRRQRRKAHLRLPVEAERTNELVDAQKVRALDLGHASLTDATLDLHLEQPLARMQVAKSPRCIVH